MAAQPYAALASLCADQEGDGSQRLPEAGQWLPVEVEAESFLVKRCPVAAGEA